MGIFSILKRYNRFKNAQKNIILNQVGLDTNYIKFISEEKINSLSWFNIEWSKKPLPASTGMRWRRLCIDLTFYLDCSFNTLSIFGLASRWCRSKGNAVAMTQ